MTDKHLMTDKFNPFKEQHSKGHISIDNPPTISAEDDLGIQISEDGRVWICVNGISFLRFTPTTRHDKKR